MDRDLCIVMNILINRIINVLEREQLEPVSVVFIESVDPISYI